jgi:hypothetical protein
VEGGVELVERVVDAGGRGIEDRIDQVVELANEQRVDLVVGGLKKKRS